MQPVADLRAAGVTVFAGSDGFRDTWTPYGNGDMLERAMLVGYRSNFRRDADLLVALETATTAGAKALRVEGYGLEPGCWASFFTVAAETIGEAIVARPRRDLVFYRGRLVARAGRFLTDAAT
jgi:cytosine/adenosine deaminase-related metal-dependent hydrolase